MFHRKRSASQSRPAPPPSVNAQSAAALAFRASTPNLSNAAAAQALRTHTPTPTMVADIQTRRMIQRGSSTSSHGSAAGSVRGKGGRPGLQRQGSTGSMTERTFRDPSPNRPGSRQSQVAASPSAPPVPPVPHAYSPLPAIPVKSHRRATSLEPPERVVSPPPKKPGGRGVSLDRGAGPTSSRPAKRAPTLSTNFEELERTDSRGSINFSYPRPYSPSPLSPSFSQGGKRVSPTSTSTPAQTNQPPVANGISSTQAAQVAHTIGEAANKPVKKKKKIVAPGAAEGSHLTSGGMGGKPSGTAVGPAVSHAPPPTTHALPLSLRAPQATVEQPDEVEPQPKKKKKKVVTSGTTPTPSELQRPQSPATSYASDSDSTPEKAVVEKRSQRASGLLNKQPSVVREDWEGEEAAAMTGGSQHGRAGAMTPVLEESPVIRSKKVTTLPNTAKKVAEPGHTRSSSQPAPVFTPSIPSAGTMPSVQHLTVGRGNGGGRGGPRTVSLSPSRSARFSAQISSELSAERKHEPPPRSVSPAKSAMKHSPSPQSRFPLDGMPGGWNKSSLRTPSEASDNTSLVSDDGAQNMAKKKKAARVSFEESPEVVGVAAPGNESNDSPIVASPQQKEGSKRNWLGLGRANQSANTNPATDDMDDVMKPRPALPSFGSVRGGKKEASQPTSRTANEIPSENTSTSSSISNLNTMDTSISSDHALGHLLTQDLASKQVPRQPPTVGTTSASDPLPPEVTTVEGSGYHSDSDSASNYSIGPRASMDGKKGSGPQSQGIPFQEYQALAESHQTLEDQPARNMTRIEEHPSFDDGQALREPSPEFSKSEDVPQIAILPATPALEQRGDEWIASLPGQFPESDQLPGSGPRRLSKDVTREVATSSPAEVGIAEPPAPEVAASHTPASAPAVSFAEALRQRDLEESDSDSGSNESIYSDAEEDLSGLDGDGFGSINAIVESPVVTAAPARLTTPPDSPLSGKPKDQTGVKRAQAGRTASWEEAQRHWSSVAQRQKQASPQPPSPIPFIPIDTAPAPKPKMKKKKSSAPTPTTTSQAIGPADSPPRSAYPTIPDRGASAPGQKSIPKSLPKSMRPQSMQNPKPQDDTPHFRSSMRTGGKAAPRGAAQRHSVADTPSAPPPQPKGALQKKNIRTAAAPPPIQTNHARNFSGSTIASQVAAQKPKAKPKASLSKTLSNDSDSESSFRRSRRASSSDGRYTMKRSMRGGPTERPNSPPVGAVGRGIRSLSPVDRRPMSTGGAMRSSMRTSMDSTAAPSLRGPKGSAKGSGGFSGFNKSKKTTTPQPSKAMTSKFKSRFASDSDDEGVAGRSFHSRYNDSSDDEPEPIRPVRGIPKRANNNDADSTDLDGSEEEHVAPNPEKPKTVNISSPKATDGGTTLRRTGSGRDLSKSTDGPVSPSADKKKGGFFGRFRSKKAQEGVVKSKAESPARRDTHLERVKAELENVSATAASPSSTPTRPPAGVRSPSQSSKLQRRGAPQRVMSDSWPLPPSPVVAAEGRPSTSDGVAVLNGNGSKKSSVPASATATPTKQNNGTTTLPTSMRPAMAKRNDSVVSARTGKKKRFTGLRRAFGLND